MLGYEDEVTITASVWVNNWLLTLLLADFLSNKDDPGWVADQLDDLFNDHLGQLTTAVEDRHRQFFNDTSTAALRVLQQMIAAAQNEPPMRH